MQKLPAIKYGLQLAVLGERSVDHFSEQLETTMLNGCEVKEDAERDDDDGDKEAAKD